MAAKDSDYLSRLQDYYAQNHSLPSYARLCDVLGLAAKSAVNKLLLRLEARGYLSQTPDKRWIPEERFFERRLSDAPVAAGHPAAVSDAISRPFLIDRFLVDKPSETMVIPVRGDSMIDAGIHDGDRVVVEMRTDARSGDIVVAMVDGEFTVKTLDTKRGKPVLLPANKDYPVIRPKGSLELVGVVVGLMRKYGK